MKESILDQNRIENGKVVYRRVKLFDRESEEYKQVCREFNKLLFVYRRFNEKFKMGE